jgi:hypothetical protein
MSTSWKPDDSWFLSRKGQEGVDKINKALHDHGFSTKRDQILTSQDPNMDLVIKDLTRTDLPPGWTGYQIPLFLMQTPPTFFFYQEADAGAELPPHSHGVDQLRIVISGGLVFGDLTLKAGDWMFIPAKAPYSISAAKNPGLVVCYMYG